MKNRSARKIVTLCYDHLGGILGEQFFSFMVKEEWLTQQTADTQIDPRNYEITDKGWKALQAFGIDTAKLRSSKRKMVSPCIERRSGCYFEHTGAHLGSLLTKRLFELEWLVQLGDKDYALSKEGYQGLQTLGISIDYRFMD